jgi:hypothetical protein
MATTVYDSSALPDEVEDEAQYKEARRKNGRRNTLRKKTKIQGPK